MAAEIKAFSWDIYQFDNIRLSEKNIRQLLEYTPAKEALKQLTEFALGTEDARKIAAKLPEKQFLHFAIAYDKKAGLKLIFQQTVGCQKKIKEKIVARSDDERLKAFSEQIAILEKYIDAIKTLEKPFKEKSIKSQIGSKTSKAKDTEFKTIQKTQKIFQELIEENKEFVKKESSHQKIVRLIEVLFVAAYIDGFVRNVVDVASKSAATVVNYMVGLGGALLVLSGISSMLSNGIKIAKSVAIKSLESTILSITDFLSSSGISVIGAALLAKVIAAFQDMATVASNAFSVVPYAMIVTNCLVLASVIYQIVMVVKFKIKLHQLSSRNKDDETQNLIEVLTWLQSILKPSKPEETNTEERTKNIISKKWSEFQVRTGEKAYAFIEKLLSKDSNIHIDDLLNKLRGTDENQKEMATIMAKDIVESLKEESTKNCLYLVLRAVASLVLISVGFAMLFDGGVISSAATSIWVAVACAIAIVIDSTPLRLWLLTQFESIFQWFSDHIEKIKERARRRIEEKDIGLFAGFIDIEKHENWLEEFAYIAEIIDYTIENIKDSQFCPWIISALPENIRPFAENVLGRNSGEDANEEKDDPSGSPCAYADLGEGSNNCLSRKNSSVVEILDDDSVIST